MYKKGYIYKVKACTGARSVKQHWQRNRISDHRSPSIYVRFPVVDAKVKLPEPTTPGCNLDDNSLDDPG